MKRRKESQEELKGRYTIVLDRKYRDFLEEESTKQKRTLSSIIEIALEQMMNNK